MRTRQTVRPRPAPNTAAWLDCLEAAINDGDLAQLERVQAVLRLAPAEQGTPLSAAAVESSWGPSEPESRADPLVAPEGRSLRGAYARRAR